MPNSYTAIPGIVAGNLQVSGNVTIQGDVLRIGSQSPFIRVYKKSQFVGQLSTNIQQDGVTRDDVSHTGIVHGMNTAIDGPDLFRENTAGNGMDTAYTSVLFSDYTSHVHTGTVTQDTIVSKLVRGGVIGANGALRGRCQFQSTTQGAGSSVIFAKLGVVIANFNISAAGQYLFEFFLGNRNAQNNSEIWGMLTNLTTGAVVGVASTTANDNSVDNTFSVALQNANTTDSQTVNEVILFLDNSFGPV